MPAQLGPDEFEGFRRLILRESGIALSAAKAPLVSSRLSRRLKARGLDSFRDYYRLVCADGSVDERQAMVNAITTNKTAFFREPHHFQLLRDTILKGIVERATGGRPRRLRIWSAGCSTGAEPYTIAMTVRDALEGAVGWDVRIVASDIDTDVLEKARQAVYPEAELAELPPDIVRRHFLRGTGRWEGQARVKDSVRELVEFEQINLTAETWDVTDRFDVVFCRNVMIYFNRETQQRLLARFADVLDPAGFVILGHSENLHGLTSRFTPAGQTAYRLETMAPVVQEVLPTLSVDVGQLRVSQQPVVLRTVLGSCVSACVFDPVSQVGGMNHFLLPEGEGPSLRYGVGAMDALVERIIESGGVRTRLRAKIFGAVEASWITNGHQAASAKNAAFAKAYLGQARIPIVGERLGGSAPIEVRCHTASGRVQVRPIHPDQFARQSASWAADHVTQADRGAAEA